MKKKHLLLFLLGMCSATMASAQNASEEIDEEALTERIHQDVTSHLLGHAEWGITHLTGNCERELSDASASRSLQKLQSPQKALTPEKLYQERSKAVLMFGNCYNCGECDQLHTGIGATATALTPDGICLTNYHVMEDIISRNRKGLEGDSLYYVANREGKCYPILRVLAYSRSQDIAIFQVDTRGDALSYVPLGDAAPTASRIHLISHPKQLFYTYGQGVVARYARQTYRGVVLHRMDITADFAVGSSGGPIMNDYGQLVGMVASTTGLYFDDERKSLQMVLKSTIPVNEIKKTLKLKP